MRSRTFKQQVRVMHSRVIWEKIQSYPEGAPFKAGMFREIAPMTAIRRTLSKLVKSGTLMRVTRGVYVRPEISRYAGPVPPSSGAILRLVAEGETITLSGIEAAQRLGLITQMVLKEIYWTSGRTRQIRLTNGSIIYLRHASPRTLALSGRPAGYALIALWGLGKTWLTSRHIHTLRRKLPPKEFQVLREAEPLMPRWMKERFLDEENSPEKWEQWEKSCSDTEE